LPRGLCILLSEPPVLPELTPVGYSQRY